jgi:hypothetical protein
MMTRIVFAVCALAFAAFAQGPPPAEAGVAVFQTGGAFFQSDVPPPPGGIAAGGDVVFVHAEIGGAGKVVKGAPYSAQVVTEHTQTLADGNTISNKQTGAIYRDSEGRTRREQPLGPIGPLPPPMGTNPIFINDPVAGTSYVLNGDNKTAQKMPMPKVEYAGAPVSHAAMKTQNAATLQSTGAHQFARESLGTKVVEGVQAEGSRTVMTIAAGEIGNAKPIETVSERWYSPQLQTVVMSKTSDPRMGETTYRLTNISLDEPAAALFEVPADYKVTEGPQKDMKMIIRKEVREEPK